MVAAKIRRTFNISLYSYHKWSKNVSSGKEKKHMLFDEQLENKVRWMIELWNHVIGYLLMKVKRINYIKYMVDSNDWGPKSSEDKINE
jgi:hypothetical protein